MDFERWSERSGNGGRRAFVGRHPSRTAWDALVVSPPMPSVWRPVAGQVALIEGEGDEDRMTGVVLGAEDDAIVVHLGGARTVAPGEVVASFVAPDALYRITATLSFHDGTSGVVDLRSHHVERVQRRTASRVALTVPVVLSNFDDPAAGDPTAFSSLGGESVDLGEGGCRVRVRDAFPEGCDPTVSLELPTGRTVVALAAISQAIELPVGYEYRLVFLSIDPSDRAALGELARD